MSALDNLGPHLLGRVPSSPDTRDYRLEDFLSGDPLVQSYTALLTSRAARATKDWATQVMLKQGWISPTPTPPSPAPSGNVWADNDPVLDQGQTGHCVGFGGAQWGNTLPVDDHYANADGDSLYYAAKVVDGEPNQESGSSVRSLAVVLKEKGLIDAYAWASSVEAIQQFIEQSGPVIVGTDWTNDMFNPNADGYITPTGGVVGGHCYVLVGYLPSTDSFTLLNSWGEGWAQQGRAYIKSADFATLLAQGGEALAAVEVAH